MKSYVKPQLTAFSLSGNEELCTACSQKIRDDPSLQDMFIDYDTNGDGLTKNELDMLFSEGDGCTEKFYGYCKFSVSDNHIMWS